MYIQKSIKCCLVLVLALIIGGCVGEFGARLIGDAINDSVTSRRSTANIGPTPGIDNEETIVKKYGKPNRIIEIDQTGDKQVMVYLNERNNIVNLLAIMYDPDKNTKVLKKVRQVTQESYLKIKQLGREREIEVCIKGFPFFLEPIPASSSLSPATSPVKPASSPPPPAFQGEIPMKSFK